MFHPFSDFLLHPMGTGDGIVQVGPADTANKLPMFPLWGLRMRPRHMHDLGSLTLEDAILRHRARGCNTRRTLPRMTRRREHKQITSLNSL